MAYAARGQPDYSRGVKAAAVVLAGGRSSRMGTPKADLPWHGSTLLRRTVGVVSRGTSGPVVVVRAPGQQLPELPPAVQVHDDPQEGYGPLQGLAVGLHALQGSADVAFCCSTDLPFLHPVFVRRVVEALGDEYDVVLPMARGHRQPLAAAYRPALGELDRRPARRRRTQARPRLRPVPGAAAARRGPAGRRPAGHRRPRAGVGAQPERAGRLRAGALPARAPRSGSSGSASWPATATAAPVRSAPPPWPQPRRPPASPSSRTWWPPSPATGSPATR